MGTTKDITGQIFGKWTVVEKRGLSKNNHCLWLCRCECGTEKEISGTNLRLGRSKKCLRCANRHNTHNYPKDIAGNCYGNWEVLSLSSQHKNKTWLCRCSCGTEKYVTQGNLISGLSTRCSKCAYSRQVKDISGRRFSKLVAIEIVDISPTGLRIWKCLCDCGNPVQIPISRLTRGDITSCGCDKKVRTREGKSYTKEYRAAATARRYEIKKNLDSVWTTELALKLAEMFPTCVVCGSSSRLSADHVLPLSKGYGLRPGNVVRLCVFCNSRKSAKDLDDLPAGWKEKIIEAAESFLLWVGSEID